MADNPNKNQKGRFASTGISLPVELMKRIDIERGDIPRSKFITRIILQRARDKKKEMNNLELGEEKAKSKVET